MTEERSHLRGDSAGGGSTGSREIEGLVVPAQQTALAAGAYLAERTFADRALAGSPKELVVGPDGFGSIADALAAAGPEDTVRIRPGSHRSGGFVLRDRRRLVGERDDSGDVAAVIELDEGTIEIEGDSSIDGVEISDWGFREEGDPPLLVAVSGSPRLVAVRVDYSEAVTTVIRAADASATDCELGLVHILGGSAARLENCDLASLTVSGAYPLFRNCKTWGNTVIEAAGGGRFETCILGRDNLLGGSAASIGLEVRDPGTAPIIADCWIYGGYRGVVFWRGAGGRLENCDIEVSWSPGKLAAFHGRLAPDSLVGQLVNRANAIDPGKLLHGLPREVVPSRFCDPDFRPAVGIRDPHTSPTLERCRLKAPFGVELDTDAEPVLDYEWEDNSVEIGNSWSALTPPQSPDIPEEQRGRYWASNEAFLQQARKEYPAKAELWAALRDDVKAGLFDL